MPQELQQITRSLSEKEKMSAIIWLVIGIMQCLSFVCVIAGAWNIYCAVTRFKQANAVLTPWKGIVNTYDQWQSNIIVGLGINLILGGVIGIAGNLYDLLVVRKYVLDNRQVFESAGL